MRVMMLHNRYGSSAPSGENKVFDAELLLLRQRGHVVNDLIRDSDEIRNKGVFGKVQGALATPWNPWMARLVQKEVDRFRPHIVHVHNTFPLISPSIFHAVGSRAPKIITVHNYRLLCPAAIPMRQGKVCTECIDQRSAWPALRHKCYRQSRVATLPVAAMVELHRRLGTWTSQIDGFIALSDFQRKLMCEAGLPSAKMYVKPNFYPTTPAVLPWEKRGAYFVYAGRLSEEKGVLSLLKAWQCWGASAPELRLLGDGPLRPQLERMASGLPVRFLGQLNAVEAQAQIANCRLVIVPSEWFETFGLVISEAFAFGTPVAVSEIGPLPSMVGYGESGLMFKPANPASLVDTLRTAWKTPGLLERLGRRARTVFIGKYTQDANYAMLIDIYQKVIDGSNAAMMRH